MKEREREMYEMQRKRKEGKNKEELVAKCEGMIGDK